MRLSIRVLGLVLATAALASPAAAQKRLDIGAFGGMTVPTNEAGDLYKIGWHGGGTARLKDDNWAVGVQLDLLYHTFASEDFRFDGGLDMLSGVLSVVWPVELENTAFTPVLHAGVGVFNLDAKFPRTTEPYGSKTRFGLSLGGGFEWRTRTSRLIPMFDMRVNGLFGSDPREGGYLLLSGGLKYSFGGKKKSLDDE